MDRSLPVGDKGVAGVDTAGEGVDDALDSGGDGTIEAISNGEVRIEAGFGEGKGGKYRNIVNYFDRFGTRLIYYGFR